MEPDESDGKDGLSRGGCTILKLDRRLFVVCAAMREFTLTWNLKPTRLIHDSHVLEIGCSRPQ